MTYSTRPVRSSDHLSSDRSRVKITIFLILLLLAVLVVEEFATPFVVTVYSKGCWSVNSAGLFQHFNVQGCGTQSWMMVDVYAHVNTQPVAGGANDVSIVLTQGAGLGGGCVGGSMCAALGLLYQPPSPLTCQGCVFTSAGLPNPAGDWFGGGVSELPFIPVALLVYLAVSLLSAPRLYRGYLNGERGLVGWKDFSEGEKTLTVFALGYIGFRSYQFVATAVYLFVEPVETLGFVLEAFVTILAAVWLMRYLRWKLPLGSSASHYLMAGSA